MTSDGDVTMSAASPDQMVVADDWSDLARFRPMPEIDHDRLRAYRRGRLVAALKKHDAAMCLIVNPISLRYATEYRVYGLFQSHIPTTYAFVPQEGPVVMHGVYGPPPGADRTAPGRALNFFDGGETLSDAARLIADDVVRYLKEIGTDNRRVAVLVGSLRRESLNRRLALALAAGVWAAFLRERQPWYLLRAVFLGLVTYQAALMLEMTFTRFPGEMPTRLTQASDLAELEKVVAGTKGPVLADEQMGMVTLAGKRLMLQPFEMTQLAAAGVWDQTPLLDAMKAGEYDLIIQYDVPWVRERWSPEMFAALDESYRLAAVIGNNRVFKPRTAAVATGPTTCEGAPWSVPTRAELGVRWDDGALVFFGRGIENQIPVVAVADGETRVLGDRPGAVALKLADPLNPGQDLWMVIDGLANGTGDVSYVSESLTTGGTVSAGTTIGEQGSWSGKATFPMWVHVRVALVRPTASGELPAVISAADYLDPRPYFGLDLPDPGAMTGSKTLACATP